MTTYDGEIIIAGSTKFSGGIAMVGVDPSAAIAVPYPKLATCYQISKLDAKMDDGKPFLGQLQARVCATASLYADYGSNGYGASSFFYYDFKGF